MFIGGALLDAIGPRWSLVTNCVIFAAGTAMFGFAPSSGSDALYFIGFATFAWSGINIWMSLLSIAELFPKYIFVVRG
jgi:MFS family permease